MIPRPIQSSAAQTKLSQPTLIRNALICQPAQTPSRADLLLDAGRISRIAAPFSLPQEAADVIDGSRRIVMAGLVNAHTHGHANLAKGMADRWPLEASLTHGPWLGGSRSAELVYHSTLLGAAEMVSRGVSACFDLVFGFPLPDPDHLLAVAQAYHDAGMRAVLAPMVADIAFVDSVPGLRAALPADLASQLACAPDAALILQALDRVMALRLPAGISLGLAPTIPHQCSPALLQGCAARAREAGLPLHMHVAESRLQAEIAQSQFGMSPIRWLDHLGVLGANFIAAHAVWLGRDDFALLADHGAGVAHIPASNLRLGCGFADLSLMQAQGLRIGLATDGCNSSDALNMFEAMRLASGGTRLRGRAHEAWLTADDALAMGTIGGADLLYPGQQIGRIREGALADLVTLDLDSFTFLPLNAPINQIITAENGGSVRDVFVAGQAVLREGCLTRIDLDKIRQDLPRLMADLYHRTSGAHALSQALVPHVLAYTEGRDRVTLPLDRYIAP